MAAGVKHGEEVSLLEKLQNSLLFLFYNQFLFAGLQRADLRASSYLRKRTSRVHFHTQPRFCFPVTLPTKNTLTVKWGLLNTEGVKSKVHFMASIGLTPSALGISMQEWGFGPEESHRRGARRGHKGSSLILGVKVPEHLFSFYWRLSLAQSK